MEAEIVFTGLCSFLNPDGKNDTMGDPGVILVRADPDPGTPPPEGGLDPTQVHRARIAYDATIATVETLEGHAQWSVVEKVPTFQQLLLDGHEVEIFTDPPGQPTVDDSFRFVVRKDDYWPEAANKWNEKAVPTAKGKKPQKDAVAAFMRFGSGTLSADRLTPNEWVIKKGDGSEHRGRFAEEVIYSDFPHNGSVLLKVASLDNPADAMLLRFTPVNPKSKLTIFVSNNEDDGIDEALRRKRAKPPLEGEHIQFLNRVADIAKVGSKGPIAEPADAPSKNDEKGEKGEKGGGGGSGFCGPGTADGGLKPKTNG